MGTLNLLIESFFKSGAEGNLVGAASVLLLLIIPVVSAFLLFGGAFAGYEACDRPKNDSAESLGRRGENWIVSTGCTVRNVFAFVRDATGYSSDTQSEGVTNPNAITPLMPGQAADEGDGEN